MTLRSLGAALIALACIALAGPALAADASTTVGLGPVWDIFVAYLLPAISVLLAALIAWVTTQIQKRTGLQIDAAHRDALHSAAMTGVQAALAKVSTRLDPLATDTKSTVVASAVAWIVKSVPDALAHFGITPATAADKLQTLVEAKLAQATGATPAATGTP